MRNALGFVTTLLVRVGTVVAAFVVVVASVVEVVVVVVDDTMSIGHMSTMTICVIVKCQA